MLDIAWSIAPIPMMIYIKSIIHFLYYESNIFVWIHLCVPHFIKIVRQSVTLVLIFGSHNSNYEFNRAFVSISSLMVDSGLYNVGSAIKMISYDRLV